MGECKLSDADANGDGHVDGIADANADSDADGADMAGGARGRQPVQRHLYHGKHQPGRGV